MSIAAEMAAFAAHSDLACASKASYAAFLWDMGAYSLAHVALGQIAALLVVFQDWPVKVFWALLVLIVAKELYGDIANARGSRWVVTDTIWDVACYLIGFFLVWGLTGMHRRGGGV